MALYSLTGWVKKKKDGGDSSFDSKWFTTRAIRQKYNAHAHVLGNIYISKS